MNKISRIVLATSNPGKLKEFTALLAPLQLEVIPQSQFNFADAEEPGLTFIENALIKARHAALRTGLPALADDSGLAVRALNGAPGIHSAYYAGSHRSAVDNMRKLLHEMRDVPDGQRQATFHTVLAFMTHAADPVPIICHGTMEGVLLHDMRGENGFGYDPVVFLPSHNKSVAELSPEEKNKISHRALALHELVKQLAEKL